MKLLMISGKGARDVALGKRNAFYSTLEEFHKHWERIDIICPGPRVGKSYSSKATCPPESVAAESGAVKLFGNVHIHLSERPLLFQPFWLRNKGRELYKKHKYDLMTVHEYPPFYNGFGAWLLWRKTGIPYILEIHHVPGYPESANFKEWLYLQLTRLFISTDIRRAVAVRVVNKYQVQNFLLDAGISRKKIVYIPSFYIDLDIFKARKVKKEYDLIFIGRLESNKGIYIFLDAVALTKCTALIVGEGSLYHEINSRIQSLVIKKRVKMHGWAKGPEEIAELINKSRLLMMLSYNEGGPRVILESLACGVPVIATPVGIVPDMIRESDAVSLVGWNSSDVARETISLLGNRKEYQRKKDLSLKIAEDFEKKEDDKKLC